MQYPAGHGIRLRSELINFRGSWFPSDGDGTAILLPKHRARQESTGGQSHTYNAAVMFGVRTVRICWYIPFKYVYA